jgi:hypothetical protein
MELHLNSHNYMKAETKSCPKCGSKFECSNHNIINCGCMHIPLNSQTRKLISEKFDDCLCISCLKEYSMMSPSESELSN